jgi:hypothetical protein
MARHTVSVNWVALSAKGSSTLPMVDIILKCRAILPSIMSVRQETANMPAAMA